MFIREFVAINIILSMIFEYLSKKTLYLCGFTVVRLGSSVASGVAPVTGVALVRGPDLGAGSRPEPSVGVLRLEIRSVTAVEVALASRGPDVPYVA